MAKIVEEIAYDGAIERIERLGLTGLVGEIRNLILGLPLQVKESRDANGGAAVRKLIDSQFEAIGGWTKRVSGDLDWTKCKAINGTRVCLGVEVQFSARSDLIVVDMIHLAKAFREGRIDVGVLLVPSDRLGHFLTDRGPKISDAKRHVDAARLQDAPLVVIAVEHDGPGLALPKQSKR